MMRLFPVMFPVMFRRFPITGLRFIGHLLLAFLAGSVLSSCGLFSSDDEVKPSPLVDIEETVSLDKLWSRGVGSQGDEEFYIRIAPAVDGERIYAADEKGDVIALNRMDDKKIWKTDVDQPLISAVGAGEGLVLLGSINGELIALSEENGEALWTVHQSSEMLAAAQVSDGVVVTQCMDGKVHAYRATDGGEMWSYSSSVPPLTLRASAAPLVYSGTVYAAFPNGKVVAIDLKTGLQFWEQQVSVPSGRNELERLMNVDGPMLLAGNDLYVGIYQGDVAQLDRSSGRVAWAEKISVSGQMVAGRGNLYFVGDDDVVVAMKMATGRKLWENDQMKYRRLSSPAILGDTVVVGDADGYLHLLSADTGAFTGRYHLGGGGIRNALYSDSDTLYVLANSGKLTALRLEN